MVEKNEESTPGLGANPAREFKGLSYVVGLDWYLLCTINPGSEHKCVIPGCALIGPFVVLKYPTTLFYEWVTRTWLIVC